MKRLVLVLGMIVPLLGMAAEEPKNVTQVRKEFLAAVATAGMDAKRCKLLFLETIPEGHLVQTSCSDLPSLCVFLVHPTEAQVAPLRCVQNPEYVPSTKI